MILTPANAKEYLQVLSNRAKHVRVFVRNGQGRHDLDRRDISAAIAEDITAMDDKEAQEEASKLLNRIRNGDQEAWRIVNGLRVKRWNNYVYADANRLGFFGQVEELGETDAPFFQNETMNEIGISAIAEGGAPLRRDVLKSQTITQIPLIFLTSEEITVQMRDIYHGRDVSNVNLETVNLAADMRQKVESKLDTYLTATVPNGGAFGDFSLTGNKWDRIYVTQSMTKSKNFPTSNVVTLDGNGPNTNFRPDVVVAAVDYAVRWGKAFEGQDLIPTGRILVPSADAAAFLKLLTFTAAKQNITAEKIAETGWLKVNIAGVDWTIVPDNTLDPNAGACYPEMNIHPITVYGKPSMDLDVTNDPTQYDAVKKNLRKRFQQKVFGAYLNGAMRHAMLKIIYRQPK